MWIFRVIPTAPLNLNAGGCLEFVPCRGCCRVKKEIKNVYLTCRVYKRSVFGLGWMDTTGTGPSGKEIV